jgi:prevent-host-death family protein
MKFTNIYEAKTTFSKLVERAELGEEVVIARAGKPVVKLVPYEPSKRRREGGQLKGQLWIAPDFDELPADIAEAFGISLKEDDAPA